MEKEMTIIEAIKEMEADGYTAKEIIPHMTREEKVEFLGMATYDDITTNTLLSEIFDLI